MGRGWGLQNGRGGGACEVLPLRKCGGGGGGADVETVLTMLNGEGGGWSIRSFGVVFMW